MNKYSAVISTMIALLMPVALRLQVTVFFPWLIVVFALAWFHRTPAQRLGHIGFASMWFIIWGEPRTTLLVLMVAMVLLIVIDSYAREQINWLPIALLLVLVHAAHQMVLGSMLHFVVTLVVIAQLFGGSLLLRRITHET